MRKMLLLLLFVFVLAPLGCQDMDVAGGDENSWVLDDDDEPDVGVNGGDDVLGDDIGGVDDADPGLNCPDEADGYHYVSDDPMECAVIDFGCDEGQTGFDDPDCGCGCIGEATNCPAMDARGEGYCRALFGYAFDGRSCRMIAGCECLGDDCGNLYADRRECIQENDGCLDGACEPMDVFAPGDCDMELGVVYGGSELGCYLISGCGCTGEDCDRVYDDMQACIDDHAHCQCGDLDGVVCDIYPSIDPADCPDGSTYTVINCEPQCVDPLTCEKV